VAQDAALKTRKAAEKPHAPELRKLNAGLSASAGAVDKARQEATQALEKLVVALRDHNEAVGAAHARLVALALPLGDEHAEYDNGHGSGGTLRISGTYRAPVPTDTVVQIVVAEVAKRAFGLQHPAAQVRDIRAKSLARNNRGLKVA
jgi:hypothetical protein